MQHKINTRTNNPHVPNATLCGVSKVDTVLSAGTYTTVFTSTGTRTYVTVMLQSVDTAAAVNYVIGDATVDQFPPMTSVWTLPRGEMVIHTLWLTGGEALYMRASTDIKLTITSKDER